MKKRCDMLGIKKKCKPEDWFKTAEKLSRKHKLPAPYGSLFEYYLSTTWVTKRDNHGHYDFFRYAQATDKFDDVIKDLYSILPPHLLQNFSEALEKFNALGEDPDYDDMCAALDPHDDYAYERNEEIEEIIKKYIELNNL